MKISTIFGTRPEAIKMCPVVSALRELPDLTCNVCVTAQHRQMLDQVLSVFSIQPDVDLDLMQNGQSLGEFAAQAIGQLSKYLQEKRPDMVLVQGDTTTVLCAALAAFYLHIPVGHVEAGLRTWNLESPWPEEANRVLTTRLSALHFAPTLESEANLLKEGIARERVLVTGNTVVDALMAVVARQAGRTLLVRGLAPEVSRSSDWVLITSHRRENLGKGLEGICRSIKRLAAEFKNTHFIFPVHLSPNVRKTVTEILGGINAPNLVAPQNIHLIDPVEYPEFVYLMSRSRLILTDSGGVQEEAPSLGRPVLLLRDTTERPEAVASGVVKLVGTDEKAIVGAASKILRTASPANQVNVKNPYGDGRAAIRIATACRDYLLRSQQSIR